MSHRKVKIRIKRRRKPKLTFGRRLARFAKLAVALLIIAVISLTVFTYTRFGKINSVALPETDELLGINSGAGYMHGENIINIALLGTDADDGEGNMRSDTLIIVSFDKEKNDVTFTSILRDTYVHIPDHGYRKINSAYQMGGAPLTVETLNSCFDMNIRDFIAFDFSSLIDIVDAVGGIELTLTESENENFNNCLANINNTYAPYDPSPHLSIGRHVFDGKQALAYTRMRYTGNGDFDRAARQRIVLEGVLTKIRCNFRLSMLYKLPACIGENITTSMGSKELIKTGFMLLKSSRNMITHSLSSSSYMRAATIDGLDMLVPYDLDDMAAALHSFIYYSDYAPSDDLKELSRELKNHISPYEIRRIDTDITL